MKNERSNRNKNSERGSATTATSPRKSDEYGNRVRENDESLRDFGTESSEQRNNVSIGNEQNPGNGTTNNRVTIQPGYYFTPSGDVARIPDGYTIGIDGRLRKQRKSKSDGSNTPDGNENSNRTETGESEKYASEIPIRTVNARGRKAKKQTENQQRLTMIAMLTVACSATFTSIALLTKHQHWNLETGEVNPLAEALNDAFATLPGKTYEAILAIIEKWVPWVNLVFVFSAVIIPRIEDSVKQYEASRFTTDKRSNKRNARTENNSWDSESSVGFNN